MAKTEQTSIKEVKDHSLSWRTLKAAMKDIWAQVAVMLVSLAALGYGGFRLHRDGLTHTNLALVIGALGPPWQC